MIDTDILVDFLRGRDEAISFVQNAEDALVSVVSISELYAGVRDAREERQLADFLKLFEIVPLEQGVAKIGGQFRRKYGPSHGSGLADCMIAATAHHHQASLVTRNKKHFPMIKNVLTPYA